MAAVKLEYRRQPRAKVYIKATWRYQLDTYGQPEVSIKST